MDIENLIVSKNEPITLIGGGYVDKTGLSLALKHAETIVAADGGADRALEFGVTPKAVFGDFDSVTDDALAQIPQEHQYRISEQDSTDFEKALREIEAPLVIGVGFTGARLDHQLAVFNTLARFPEQRCLLLGAHEVVFLCPPSFRLDLTKGSTVSLFAMGAVEGVSDGLKWPIRGLHFAPDGQSGTSNIATGSIELAFTAPKMLVMLPRTAFDIAVETLLNTPSQWTT